MTGYQTRGECAVCGLDVAMRLDGTYRRHRDPSGRSYCAGSLTAPPEDDAYRVAYEQSIHEHYPDGFLPGERDPFDDGFDAGWQRAVDWMRERYGL